MSKSIRLIVGLGNPGPEYAATRHNAGFHFVDALAARKGASFRDERKFQGEVCRITLAGHDVWLLKPTTFMNCSGRAVAALALYYKIQPDEILVVHDEMDLEPGTMRLKQGGGNAGHNGLKDITAALSTPNFWRLRLGIGHPRKLGLAQEVFAFVLSAPNADHEAALRQCIDAGISVVEEIAGGGFEKAQRRLEPLSGRPEKNTRATSTAAPVKKGGPKILVSRCLLGYKCRYDGESRPSLFEALAEKGWGADDIITFCPETEGGLPTPREPAEIVSDEGGDGHAVIAKLAHVVTRSGTDVTAEYLRGARKALKAARSAYIVCVLGKARSPACGCGSIYDGTHTRTLRPGSGVAAALLEKNGYLVLTEEELDQLPPKPAP